MPSVAFYTLGCKVNFYDTEAIWQIFQKAGYEQVNFAYKADVYFINTCTVTNTGDKKSRQIIRRAVRRNPEAIIAVTGCYAQTSTEEVLAIPGVDLVIGTQDRKNLLTYIKEIQQKRQPINAVSNVMKTREFEELDVPYFSGKTRAFLKIQEGCNNFCSFCIIPWARGLSRSRDPKSVLHQSGQLIAAGYKEIVLTGIHTGGYGDDLQNYALTDLLIDLNSIKGLERIRISSIEASQIDDRMIVLLNRLPKLCRHLHIPLQAGDDMILKQMRRKYTTVEFADKVKKIHQALPQISITTDVIVGFPGETEEQFNHTLAFVEQMKFSKIHVFPYSQRTGTLASRMENQVPEKVKQARVQKLVALSERLQREYAQQWVGKKLDIIPEKESQLTRKPGELAGYSDNYLPVTFKGDSHLVGKLCTVKITEYNVPACQGELITAIEEVI